MKNKIAVALFALAIAVASCSKPSETPDTDGKDSIVNDTTNSNVADTVQVAPADTTAAAN
jgi:hypothetical protein